MTVVQDERRVHPRVAIEHPCKVYDPLSRRYFNGTTSNLSTHGIYLHVPRPLALRPGDTILVGVAVSEHQALIKAKEMVEVEIIRVLRTWDGGTALAVRVTEEHPIEHVRLAA